MKQMREMDWVVRLSLFDDPSRPVTVADVMEKYNWSHGKAQRCLERMVAVGLARRRVKTFWNGMHYAKRFYYW